MNVFDYHNCMKKEKIKVTFEADPMYENGDQDEDSELERYSK